MRRGLLAAVAGVATIGVTVGPAAAGPSTQWVGGQGENAQGTLLVKAQSDVGGANPEGTVRFDYPFHPGWEFEGPVLCLRVDGGRAVVGTVLSGVGTTYFHITEGSKFNGVPLPDRYEAQFGQTTPPDECPAPSGQGDNVKGNFYIQAPARISKG